MKKMKIPFMVFVAVLTVLALSACSGVIGGESGVRISVDGLSDGRYISPTANSGYVVVMQKNKVYSLNNFSDKAYYALTNGYVYITNLPIGTYIFGIALMDNLDDDIDDNDLNYGIAVKEVEIKKGFNNVAIKVAPGLSLFEIDTIDGPLDVSDFFYPDGYSASFADNTIIIGELPQIRLIST